MNDNLVQRVRRIRARNPLVPTSMVDAFRQARTETDPSVAYDFLRGLDDSPSKVTGEINGLTVTVEVVNDDESQLGEDDVTGTFGDTDQEGAVRYNLNGNNGQGCRYYYPSNSRMSGDERPFWHRRGLSRARVADYERWLILDDMRQDADRFYLGVIATVSVDGAKLGEASLWAIDSVLWDYDNKPYLYEVAKDQIDEAMDAARDNAPAMVKHAREMAAKVEKLLVKTTADQEE